MEPRQRRYHKAMDEPSAFLEPAHPEKPIDYEALADFRFAIREFLATSERFAQEKGLTPQQHQGLLAVAGCPRDRLPTIGYLAERLFLEHHSTVGLINRLADLELVERQTVASDRRQVVVALTSHGTDILRELSGIHSQELRHRAPHLVEVLTRITGVGATPYWQREGLNG